MLLKVTMKNMVNALELPNKNQLKQNKTVHLVNISTQSIINVKAVIVIAGPVPKITFALHVSMDLSWCKIVKVKMNAKRLVGKKRSMTTIILKMKMKK